MLPSVLITRTKELLHSLFEYSTHPAPAQLKLPRQRRHKFLFDAGHSLPDGGAILLAHVMLQ